MTSALEFETFRAAYEAGQPQVVWRILVADLETPVSAFMKLAAGQSHTFLLESVEGGAVRGRYSVLGMKPDLIWKCDGNQAWINRDARTRPDDFAPCPVAAEHGTLASFRALVAESRIDIPPHLPPMSAGLIGYMSYDMVRLAEKLPDNNPDVIGVPDGIFMRPTVMAMFDNVNGTLTAVVPVWPRPGIDARAAYDLAHERLEHVVEALERPCPTLRTSSTAPATRRPRCRRCRPRNIAPRC